MIIDAILNWLADMFHAVSVNALTGPGLGGMSFGMIDDVNYFLPVGEMFMLFMAFFALGGPMMTTSLLVWFLVGVLRGGQSKS